MDELIEATLKEIKFTIGDSLAFWQQDMIYRRIREAMELAYKEGRSDENYKQRGPRVLNIYE